MFNFLAPESNNGNIEPREDKGIDEYTIHIMAGVIAILVLILVSMIVRHYRTRNTHHVSDVEMRAFSTFE